MESWLFEPKNRQVKYARSGKNGLDLSPFQYFLHSPTESIICRFVDDIVTVSEEEIASAMLKAAMETHLLLEPSGALGLAAALTYAKPLSQGKPVIALTSGGNTTLESLYHLQVTKESA